MDARTVGTRQILPYHLKKQRKKGEQQNIHVAPCSRNARPEEGLVRRPHIDQHGCPSKRGNARPCDPSDSQALAHCKVILDRYAELAQDGSVIENFRNKVLARFFEDDDRRKLPAPQIDKIARILARLNEAITVQDMGLPGYRLHPLKGERAGFWSVTVSGNWRIIFRFENGSAFDVDLIDYH